VDARKFHRVAKFKHKNLAWRYSNEFEFCRDQQSKLSSFKKHLRRHENISFDMASELQYDDRYAPLVV